MSNFDDLSMAVASFGGNNAVKFDDLGSICRGRVGGSHKGFLPVISPFDVRWRGNCCRSSVLLLESKGRKPAENQSCIPGVVRHAV